ncbi:VWA domain-containing protein [Cereibacter sphaeroides]|uniref:vWA domain-containing protein n=1 Tax=Cereibacter sphaeroides TaxID=1063 RepID=UPI001F395DCE|nr:vWA domain-containing protein [Cereibacter sphaeroides]MCE6951776.1 VWA domain-containing protein [Cereibacter sphaeroides]
MFHRFLAAFLLMATAAAAADRVPLVMDGKTSLPQRVLVRQATERLDAPDGHPLGSALPLQQFFVYGRSEGWVEVGPSQDGRDLGWLPVTAVADWNQNIVATLEVTAGLDRTLFLSDLDTAYDLVEAEDPGTEAAALRAEAEAAERSGTPSNRVVALGPREAIDQRQRLHVLPILDAEEALFENGTFVNLLKVAVARTGGRDAAGPAATEKPIGGVPDAPRAGMRAGVVFVVDTTHSMGPYIDATREALSGVYREVAAANLTDRVSFGLVGYRDSLRGQPLLEYAARTFVTLDEGRSEAGFLAGIRTMTEATASSRGFREDSYTGLEHAVSSLDWSGYDVRLVVLVTDAGPREPTDELSGTGLSGEALNRLVREQLGGYVAVIHLLTPKGAEVGDHERATRLYRELTTFPNLPPLYFAVPKGEAAAYEAAARQVGQVVVDQLSASARDAGGPAPVPDTPIASAVGQAMQTLRLAYLGRQDGTEAPDVFEGVIADRDFAQPALRPVSIRLLLSKAQLSDLAEALQIVVDKAEANVLDPDRFFEQVLGAAADMSRRPESVSRRQDETLAGAVAVSELLEGLPYRSRIMTITQEDWVRMSISEQQALVNDLHDKLERYRRYNASPDLWVNHLGQPGADGLLYPMLLDDLP